MLGQPVISRLMSQNTARTHGHIGFTFIRGHQQGFQQMFNQQVCILSAAQLPEPLLTVSCADQRSIAALRIVIDLSSQLFLGPRQT